MILASVRPCKAFLLSVLICICIPFLYAEEEETWVFAASQFDSSIKDDPTAELIPLYILQNFSEAATRNVTPEEQYRDVQKTYDGELSDLYERLQDAVYEKDSLMVTQQNSFGFNDELTEKEDAIEAIQIDIQELIAEKEVLKISDYKTVEKEITLWNDNRDSLYPITEKHLYSEPQGINALITGTIEYAESYIYVTTQLTLYPGNVIELELLEVDSITAIRELSKRIADELYIALANKKEVHIQFQVEPKEALEQTTIHIDGNLLKYQENNEGFFSQLTLPGSIYEFYVESPGYEGISVSYPFNESDNYTVAIRLLSKRSQEHSFVIPNANGDLFLNTQKMTTQTSENNADSENTETKGVVTVNGFPALGEFVSEEGVSTWFLLNETEKDFEQHSSIDNAFSFEPNTKNFEDVIEKNRKRMYNSYAALIVSLPLYFIANGQYLNEYNSWATGKASGEKVQDWQTARDVTLGVSIGLGVNFLVQLGIYIYSANSILPKEVPIRN